MIKEFSKQIRKLHISSTNFLIILTKKKYICSFHKYFFIYFKITQHNIISDTHFQFEVILFDIHYSDEMGW